MPLASRISRLLLVPGMCLFAANAAAVQGLSLSWNACSGDAGASQNRNFACNSNLLTNSLHGSFTLGTPMAAVIGVEIVVDVRSESATLPAWWQLFYAGTCRPNSLSASFQPNGDAVACQDWANLLAFGAIAGYCTLANTIPDGCGLPGQDANWARIKLIAAVTSDLAQDLVANQSYFTFILGINNRLTTGAGACAGCSTPACIVLNSIKVVARDNVEQRFISSPAAPGSNSVTWQGGGPICGAVTLARTSTWGAVKSLYR